MLKKPTYEDLELRIKKLEKEKKSSQQTDDNFFKVLNSIDATVYVADMDTYEILFANNFMIESFNRDVNGELCHKVFRNEDEPCADCTNSKLINSDGVPTGLQVWDGKNPITHKWYINYDRAIKWNDGRIVKLQIATDITELKNAYTTIEKMSITDDLTQIFNRRYFHACLNEEVQRVQRYKKNLSLIMMDIDHFKSVNDNYGHQTGDEVLIKISSILKSNVRKVDVVARYGGEEFIILLPETNGKGAYKVAEKLRILIADYKIKNKDGKEFHISSSFGVSSLKEVTDVEKDIDDIIIKLADNALYEAKKTGRNKVVCSW